MMHRMPDRGLIFLGTILFEARNALIVMRGLAWRRMLHHRIIE